MSNSYSRLNGTIIDAAAGYATEVDNDTTLD